MVPSGRICFFGADELHPEGHSQPGVGEALGPNMYFIHAEQTIVLHRASVSRWGGGRGTLDMKLCVR